MCLGDHPDVNRGAPVSLDWDYQSEQSFDIEEYERITGGRAKKTEDEMKRLAFEREYMLRKLGYSMEEIESQSKIVRQDQKKRSQTRRNMIFEPFMIMSEETKQWIAKKKRKNSRKKLDDGNKQSMRSLPKREGSTTSTSSGESSSFRPRSNFVNESMIACNQ